jgi:transcriptional regulator with PAS, ATPase and Fis domain
VGRRKFITRDPATLEVLEEVRCAALLPVPILIRGETGVGKDLVAEMIHLASGRQGEPFVAVNAAALPRELFESSLFGHVRGAFTGAIASHPGFLEAAGRGTIFLDEIAELEWGLQAKILRMLDRGEYTPVGGTKRLASRARVIAATNRDLESLCKKGLFREDLLYRLAVLVFTIPPLRRRRCDIEPLAEHILSRATGSYGTGSHHVTGEALLLLGSYNWPGNVRELEGELLRAMVRARGGPIGVRHLSKCVLLRATVREEGKEYSVSHANLKLCSGGLDGRIDELMRNEIERALRASGGNKAEAARVLGIKRTTLLYRMKRLGIALPEG